jgi:hypothetical protein
MRWYRSHPVHARQIHVEVVSFPEVLSGFGISRLLPCTVRSSASQGTCQSFSVVASFPCGWRSWIGAGPPRGCIAITCKIMAHAQYVLKVLKPWSISCYPVFTAGRYGTSFFGCQADITSLRVLTLSSLIGGCSQENLQRASSWLDTFFILIVWSIWKERVFQRESQQVHDLIRCIKTEGSLWVGAGYTSSSNLIH